MLLKEPGARSREPGITMVSFLLPFSCFSIIIDRKEPDLWPICGHSEAIAIRLKNPRT